MTKIISRISAGIVVVLLGIWFNYLFMPAWTFRSPGMWMFLLIMSVIATIAFGVVGAFDYDSKYPHICTLVMASIAVIILIVLLIGGLTSSHMFRADDYHNMISFEQGSFEEDVPSIKEETPISIVDVETARRVGDRTIGSIKNATWYEVDNEYNLIKYQGRYYRISPLNYGGLFKYRKAKADGIPGYVLVDCITQEAKYVELEKPIIYSPSAHYGEMLERHLRNKYGSYMFGKSFFEIDEEGNPYYITSIKTPTIGMFGGKTEDTFILTSADTGECTELTVSELPEWVDHAYSLDYLMQVIDYNQEYINGFWNFSHTGVNKTTYQYKNSQFSGYNTTITSKGEVVFYTGVTPANGTESNIGFMLVNPRTGVVRYYDCAGAEESSAQSAAQGLVQNLGYVATFPTILNIDGKETYFMLLKDQAGLVQRYVFCNVKDYTKVVQSETLDGAIELYNEKVGNNAQTENEEKDNSRKLEGKIQNLYETQIDGCTFYCFTIEGDTNLYMSSIRNNSKQVMLTVGTKVIIEAVLSSEEGVYIVKMIQF